MNASQSAPRIGLAGWKSILRINPIAAVRVEVLTTGSAVHHDANRMGTCFCETVVALADLRHAAIATTCTDQNCIGLRCEQHGLTRCQNRGSVDDNVTVPASQFGKHGIEQLDIQD